MLRLMVIRSSRWTVDQSSQGVIGKISKMLVIRKSWQKQECWWLEEGGGKGKGSQGLCLVDRRDHSWVSLGLLILLGAPVLYQLGPILSERHLNDDDSVWNWSQVVMSCESCQSGLMPNDWLWSILRLNLLRWIDKSMMKIVIGSTIIGV